MPWKIPDIAACLIFQRILWESIIASPGVSTHSVYWIWFILSDLYFSIVVLYLWSADCKQSNQPSGFQLLVFHLLYNVTVETSCSRRQKRFSDWTFSSGRKICVALRLPNDNVFFWLCVCACVFDWLKVFVIFLSWYLRVQMHALVNVKIMNKKSS